LAARQVVFCEIAYAFIRVRLSQIPEPDAVFWRETNTGPEVMAPLCGGSARSSLGPSNDIEFSGERKRARCDELLATGPRSVEGVIATTSAPPSPECH